MRFSSAKGFSLVETIVSLGVLTTGILGAAAVLTSGMRNLSSSPSDVVTTQKAAEAMEAVFSARQSGKLTWAQINNVNGASGSDGGIFIDGPMSVYMPCSDGLVNTADDTDTTPATICGLETVRLPGPDQLLNTSDDQVKSLASFTREILIRDVPGENGQLRSIVVTIKYNNGTTIRTYDLTTYISAYS